MDSTNTILYSKLNDGIHDYCGISISCLTFSGSPPTQ